MTSLRVPLCLSVLGLAGLPEKRATMPHGCFGGICAPSGALRRFAPGFRRNAEGPGAGFLAELPNGDPNAELIELSNAISVSADGSAVVPPEWLDVPFADVPIDLGNVKGVQRLNRGVADRMVALFNSLRGKLAQRFGGIPIYLGHPDSKYFRDRGDTNDNAQGWILDMTASASGLRIKSEWNADGVACLVNKRRKFFSPFFLGEEVGREHGVAIYEPRMLKSVGLLNQPNWPVAPLVNAATQKDGLAVTKEGGSMNLLQRLLALIGKDAVKTEDEAVAHITSLVNSAAGIPAKDAKIVELTNSGTATGTELATVKTELATAKAALATAEDGRKAERKARVVVLVNAAVTDGRITPAEVEKFTVDLCNAVALEPEAEKLQGLAPKIKTKSVTGRLAQVNVQVHERRAKVQELINARAKDHPEEEYIAAFATIQKEHPELFPVQEGKNK